MKLADKRRCPSHPIVALLFNPAGNTFPNLQDKDKEYQDSGDAGSNNFRNFLILLEVNQFSLNLEKFPGPLEFPHSFI